jgi:transcriptional regulator with XRE-family HTH domain
MTRKLTRGQLKARVLRALSGLSQEDFERETQVENIAGIENGSRHLTASQVAQMCPSARLTPESCERLIQEYEAHVADLAHVAGNRDAAVSPVGSPRPERRPGPEQAMSIAAIIEDFEARISRHGEERSARCAAERELARRCWERVRRQGLSFDDVVLLARVAREFQSWALVELICDESMQAGEQGFAERALDLAGLAVEIAGHVRGSEAWCRCIRGFALAHLAGARHALDTAGEPGAARETFAEAERLWESGENPDRVLDAGRFAGLKASLTARRAYPS